MNHLEVAQNSGLIWWAVVTLSSSMHDDTTFEKTLNSILEAVDSLSKAEATQGPLHWEGQYVTTRGDSRNV